MRKLYMFNTRECLSQPDVRTILKKEYGIRNDTYVKYVYDGYTFQGEHPWIRKPKTQKKVRTAFQELNYNRGHAKNIVNALVELDTFEPTDYNKARSRVNEREWDKAWDFCEKEFGTMWVSISLDDKRDLVMEKYVLTCMNKELLPFLNYRPKYDKD